jgi:hypothetical protein
MSLAMTGPASSTMHTTQYTMDRLPYRIMLLRRQQEIGAFADWKKTGAFAYCVRRNPFDRAMDIPPMLRKLAPTLEQPRIALT